MKINVYKSDFAIFEGLYNAVIYLRSGITRVEQNFIEVDFGPERMNPYVIANRHSMKEGYGYNDLMNLCLSGDIESRMVYEICALLVTYTLTTKQIKRMVDNAICYPVGHVNRTIYKI
jgi:hypothetical protein